MKKTASLPTRSLLSDLVSSLEPGRPLRDRLTGGSNCVATAIRGDKKNDRPAAVSPKSDDACIDQVGVNALFFFVPR